MTNPTPLSALIEKIEAAEEGSRELDVDIAKHLGGAIRTSTTVGTRYQVLWLDAEFAQGDDINELPEVPFYTTSIDAIVGLIESELPGAFWRISSRNKAVLVSKKDHAGYARGHTPALALCASFLKALQSERGEG